MGFQRIPPLWPRCAPRRHPRPETAHFAADCKTSPSFSATFRRAANLLIQLPSKVFRGLRPSSGIHCNIKCQLTPGPSAVIALGADRPPAPPETLRAEFLATHPDLAPRRRAIFLGRLHGKKRPEAALRAMATLRQTHPDACLLFAGSGEAEADLRRMTEELGLAEHVRFLGFLSGREKWQALAAAEAFVLPSQQENFAIALAEALHAGTPALLTRKVNIWREVTEAGAGWALDEDTLETSIATHLAALFDTPEKQTTASEAARTLAGRAFDWEISGRATHALYDEVLGDRDAGRTVTHPDRLPPGAQSDVCKIR